MPLCSLSFSKHTGNLAMKELVDYQAVVSDWSSIVSLPQTHAPTEMLWEENPKLAAILNSSELTVEQINNLSVDCFHCLGEDIIWLTNEEFVWMLPVLLLHGVASEEPIFACNIIQGLQESVFESQKWLAIRKSALPKTLNWIHEKAQECCHLGWEDERRISKHGDICRKAFAAPSPNNQQDQAPADAK